MSVIFGICHPDNATIDREAILGMAATTVCYGGDGTSVIVRGPIGMGFQAFHTHRRSLLEHQPTEDQLGIIVLLDGRIDNHQELATELGVEDQALSDSDIVHEAFARWGETCFSRFIGDWALAIWSTNVRVLYLARDHAGSRNLFYRNIQGTIAWCSYLEGLVGNDGYPELDQEYMALSLAYQDVRDLTPYKSVRAVPPAHYLTIRGETVTTCPHWRWIADTRIVYQSDPEYDEHFLHLLRQAVERRIGPGAPIIAELSGGMDSSSIVCMADLIARERNEPAEQLDTVSYYDDSEPDWDERPYVIAVERHRNKSGIHIDFSSQTSSCEPLKRSARAYPYPIGDQTYLDNAAKFERSVRHGNYRVILSGIGGDELLGGVPTAMPELANYLRAGRLLRFIIRSSEWCMVNRSPLIHMLRRTIAFTLRLYQNPRPDRGRIPPWLTARSRQLCLSRSSQPVDMRGSLAALPSQLAAGHAWWATLETLPGRYPNPSGSYEYRYPFLDRDLVDFLHRIPREQLVGPGRRRLLMRRALQGILPFEILERKRKAFISHGPIARLRRAQTEIETMFENSYLSAYGLIDTEMFLQTFRAELTGELKWVGHLRRAIDLDVWVRSLTASQFETSGVSYNTADIRDNLPSSRWAQKIRGGKAAL